MLQFKSVKTQLSQQAHVQSAAWKDIALNVGKLSLAGLFIGGSLWFHSIYTA